MEGKNIKEYNIMYDLAQQNARGDKAVCNVSVVSVSLGLLFLLG